MALSLVIFDMDGTLVDSHLDFDAMRTEIGLPQGVAILEALDGLPPREQARALAVIDRHETTAAAASCLIPGATDLLAWLRGRGVRVALLTRNSRASVATALARHGLDVDAAVTREDHEPKPSPAGVRHLMEACGATADETVVVGDFRFDIEAGAAAGVRTIALAVAPTDWSAAATWTAATLAEVRGILARLLAET
jgi:HAD superfamily hydrolase (TIGR01509 family)